MAQTIKTYAVNKASLATLIGTGFWLDTAATIGLLKTGGTYGPNMTLAVVLTNEPTNVEMPGYAPISPVAWATEYRGAGGSALTDSGELIWELTADAPAPLDLVGMYFTDGTDVVVYLLDSPVRVQYKDDRAALFFPFGYA